MPGLMACREEFGSVKSCRSLNIDISLPMTTQTSVLMEILQIVGATVRWGPVTSSTRRTTLRLASRRLALPRFSHGRKRRSRIAGGSTEQMLTVSGTDGCEQLMDDGGDGTLLIHKGTELEAAIAEDGAMSDAETTRTQS